MNINEEASQYLDELVRLANNIFSDYCELRDEYVLTDEEISDISDANERDRAIEVKEIDDFLYNAKQFNEKYKQHLLSLQREIPIPILNDNIQQQIDNLKIQIRNPKYAK